jgi:small redox-active disulfide protein 2
MKHVQVLGPGCARCDETAKIVSEAIAESGGQATLEKVTDFAVMAGLGVFTTPAVVVDGEVKIVGKVPKKADVLAWIA